MEHSVKHLRKLGPTTRPYCAKKICFTRPVTLIGRSQDTNDYVLASSNRRQSTSISRIHCRVIVVNGNVHEIHDMSKNGIFINDVKINGMAVLRDGDIVTFGHTNGANIPHGTRERQPDSHFIYVFVSCNCSSGSENDPNSQAPPQTTRVPQENQENYGAPARNVSASPRRVLQPHEPASSCSCPSQMAAAGSSPRRPPELELPAPPAQQPDTNSDLPEAKSSESSPNNAGTEAENSGAIPAVPTVGSGEQVATELLPTDNTEVKDGSVPSLDALDERSVPASQDLSVSDLADSDHLTSAPEVPTSESEVIPEEEASEQPVADPPETVSDEVCVEQTPQPEQPEPKQDPSLPNVECVPEEPSPSDEVAISVAEQPEHEETQVPNSAKSEVHEPAPSQEAVVLDLPESPSNNADNSEPVIEYADAKETEPKPTNIIDTNPLIDTNAKDTDAGQVDSHDCSPQVSDVISENVTIAVHESPVSRPAAVHEGANIDTLNSGDTNVIAETDAADMVTDTEQVVNPPVFHESPATTCDNQSSTEPEPSEDASVPPLSEANYSIDEELNSQSCANITVEQNCSGLVTNTDTEDSVLSFEPFSQADQEDRKTIQEAVSDVVSRFIEQETEADNQTESAGTSQATEEVVPSASTSQDDHVPSEQDAPVDASVLQSEIYDTAIKTLDKLSDVELSNTTVKSTHESDVVVTKPAEDTVESTVMQVDAEDTSRLSQDIRDTADLVEEPTVDEAGVPEVCPDSEIVDTLVQGEIVRCVQAVDLADETQPAVHDETEGKEPYMKLYAEISQPVLHDEAEDKETDVNTDAGDNGSSMSPEPVPDVGLSRAEEDEPEASAVCIQSDMPKFESSDIEPVDQALDSSPETCKEAVQPVSTHVESVADVTTDNCMQEEAVLPVTESSLIKDVDLTVKNHNQNVDLSEEISPAVEDSTGECDVADVKPTVTTGMEDDNATQEAVPNQEVNSPQLDVTDSEILDSSPQADATEPTIELEDKSKAPDVDFAGQDSPSEVMSVPMENDGTKVCTESSDDPPELQTGPRSTDVQILKEPVPQSENTPGLELSLLSCAKRSESAGENSDQLSVPGDAEEQVLTGNTKDSGHPTDAENVAVETTGDSAEPASAGPDTVNVDSAVSGDRQDITHTVEPSPANSPITTVANAETHDSVKHSFADTEDNNPTAPVLEAEALCIENTGSPSPLYTTEHTKESCDVSTEPEATVDMALCLTTKSPNHRTEPASPDIQQDPLSVEIAETSNDCHQESCKVEVEKGNIEEPTRDPNHNDGHVTDDAFPEDFSPVESSDMKVSPSQPEGECMDESSAVIENISVSTEQPIVPATDANMSENIESQLEINPDANSAEGQSDKDEISRVISRADECVHDTEVVPETHTPEQTVIEDQLQSSCDSLVPPGTDSHDIVDKQPEDSSGKKMNPVTDNEIPVAEQPQFDPVESSSTNEEFQLENSENFGTKVTSIVDEDCPDRGKEGEDNIVEEKDDFSANQVTTDVAAESDESGPEREVYVFDVQSEKTDTSEAVNTEGEYDTEETDVIEDLEKEIDTESSRDTQLGDSAPQSAGTGSEADISQDDDGSSSVKSSNIDADSHVYFVVSGENGAETTDDTVAEAEYVPENADSENFNIATVTCKDKPLYVEEELAEQSHAVAPGTPEDKDPQTETCIVNFDEAGSVANLVESDGKNDIPVPGDICIAPSEQDLQSPKDDINEIENPEAIESENGQDNAEQLIPEVPSGDTCDPESSASKPEVEIVVSDSYAEKPEETTVSVTNVFVQNSCSPDQVNESPPAKKIRTDLQENLTMKSAAEEKNAPKLDVLLRPLNFRSPMACQLNRSATEFTSPGLSPCAQPAVGRKRALTGDNLPSVISPKKMFAGTSADADAEDHQFSDATESDSDDEFLSSQVSKKRVLSASDDDACNKKSRTEGHAEEISTEVTETVQAGEIQSTPDTCPPELVVHSPAGLDSADNLDSPLAKESAVDTEDPGIEDLCPCPVPSLADIEDNKGASQASEISEPADALDSNHGISLTQESDDYMASQESLHLYLDATQPGSVVSAAIDEEADGILDSSPLAFPLPSSQENLPSDPENDIYARTIHDVPAADAADNETLISSIEQQTVYVETGVTNSQEDNGEIQRGSEVQPVQTSPDEEMPAPGDTGSTDDKEVSSTVDNTEALTDIEAQPVETSTGDHASATDETEVTDCQKEAVSVTNTEEKPEIGPLPSNTCLSATGADETDATEDIRPSMTAVVLPRLSESEVDAPKCSTPVDADPGKPKKTVSFNEDVASTSIIADQSSSGTDPSADGDSQVFLSQEIPVVALRNLPIITGMPIIEESESPPRPRLSTVSDGLISDESHSALLASEYYTESDSAADSSVRFLPAMQQATDVIEAPEQDTENMDQCTENDDAPKTESDACLEKEESPELAEPSVDSPAAEVDATDAGNDCQVTVDGLTGTDQVRPTCVVSVESRIENVHGGPEAAELAVVSDVLEPPLHCESKDQLASSEPTTTNEVNSELTNIESAAPDNKETDTKIDDQQSPVSESAEQDAVASESVKRPASPLSDDAPCKVAKLSNESNMTSSSELSFVTSTPQRPDFVRPDTPTDDDCDTEVDEPTDPQSNLDNSSGDETAVWDSDKLSQETTSSSTHGEVTVVDTSPEVNAEETHEVTRCLEQSEVSSSSLDRTATYNDSKNADDLKCNDSRKLSDPDATFATACSQRSTYSDADMSSCEDNTFHTPTFTNNIACVAGISPENSVTPVVQLVPEEPEILNYATVTEKDEEKGEATSHEVTNQAEDENGNKPVLSTISSQQDEEVASVVSDCMDKCNDTVDSDQASEEFPVYQEEGTPRANIDINDGASSVDYSDLPEFKIVEGAADSQGSQEVMQEDKDDDAEDENITDTEEDADLSEEEGEDVATDRGDNNEEDSDEDGGAAEETDTHGASPNEDTNNSKQDLDQSDSEDADQKDNGGENNDPVDGKSTDACDDQGIIEPVNGAHADDTSTVDYSEPLGGSPIESTAEKSDSIADDTSTVDYSEPSVERTAKDALSNVTEAAAESYDASSLPGDDESCASSGENLGTTSDPADAVDDGKSCRTASEDRDGTSSTAVSVCDDNEDSSSTHQNESQSDNGLSDEEDESDAESNHESQSGESDAGDDACNWQDLDTSCDDDNADKSDGDSPTEAVNDEDPENVTTDNEMPAGQSDVQEGGTDSSIAHSTEDSAQRSESPNQMDNFEVELEVEYQPPYLGDSSNNSSLAPCESPRSSNKSPVEDQPVPELPAPEVELEVPRTAPQPVVIKPIGADSDSSIDLGRVKTEPSVSSPKPVQSKVDMPAHVRQMILRCRAKKEPKENIASYESDDGLPGSQHSTGSQDSEGAYRRRRNVVEADDAVDQQMHRTKELSQKLRRCLGNLEAQQTPRLSHWMNALDELDAKSNLPGTTIAFVGNTGDGKSSLMNAVLDHASILPTSCMRACTSVVVEVSANKVDNFYRAQILFLSQKEWEDELKLLLDELSRDGEVRNRRPEPNTQADVAWNKIRAVYGPFPDKVRKDRLLQQLLKQKAITKWLDRHKPIKDLNPVHFRKEIDRYIESNDCGDGNDFWPIVKKVSLQIPNCEALSSGATLIDLPGTGDSNPARDKIAKDYLKSSTAVWIIAAINRAIDNKQAKELLDEQFRRQLVMDGQYSSVSYICTKTDQLTPSEMIRKRELKIGERVKKQRMEIDQLDMQKGTLEAEIKKVTDDLADFQTIYQDKEREVNDLQAAIDGLSQFAQSSQYEASGELNELKEEKEKEEMGLRATRNIITEKEMQKESAAKELMKCEEDLVRNRLEISQICADARNEFARRAITKDFTAGYRDLKKKAGEDDDDDDRYDEDLDSSYDEVDDPIIKAAAEKLRVFCVSSSDYLKLCKKLSKSDGPPVVFTKKEDTGIPSLKEFIHEVTRCRRKSTADGLVRSVGRQVSEITNYLLDERTNSIKQRSGVKRVFDDRTKCLRKVDIESELFKVEQALQRKIDSLICSKVQTGVQKAEMMAEPTSAKWGAKQNRSNPEEGGYVYSTYMATCRRQGEFKSPTFGEINFNLALANPVYCQIAIAWPTIFNQEIPEILNTFFESVLRCVASYAEKLMGDLKKIGLTHVRIERFMNQMLSNVDYSFQNSIDMIKEHIQEVQKDLNRLLTPSIQSQMETAYSLCTAEKGPGSFARMKAHMETYVSTRKSDMFIKASDQLRDRLMDFLHEIMKKLKSARKCLIKDITSLLEPLWETNDDARTLRYVLMPDIRALYSAIEEHYKRSGLDLSCQELCSIREALVRYNEPPTPESTSAKRKSGQQDFSENSCDGSSDLCSNLWRQEAQPHAAAAHQPSKKQKKNPVSCTVESPARADPSCNHYKPARMAPSAPSTVTYSTQYRPGLPGYAEAATARAAASCYQAPSIAVSGQYRAKKPSHAASQIPSGIVVKQEQLDRVSQSQPVKRPSPELIHGIPGKKQRPLQDLNVHLGRELSLSQPTKKSRINVDDPAAHPGSSGLPHLAPSSSQPLPDRRGPTASQGGSKKKKKHQKTENYNYGSSSYRKTEEHSDTDDDLPTYL